MNAIALLILANVAFFAGPLCLRYINKNRKLGMFLDGITFTAILTFCFLHILPEIIEHGEYYAIAVFFVGLWFPLCPQFFQQKFNLQNSENMSLGLWLFIAIGFAIHVFSEGAILATQNSLAHLNVGFSVVIHRLGVGLVLFNFFMHKQKNPKYVYLVLGLLILGTTGGFLLGSHFGSHSEMHGILFIEAFIAGNLLHFVTQSNIFMSQNPHEGCSHSSHDPGHSHGHAHAHAHAHQKAKEQKGFVAELISNQSFSAYGALVVAAFMCFEAVYYSGSASRTQFFEIGKVFFMLLSESALPLLLAFLAAGVFKTFVQPAHLSWLTKGNRLSQTSKGIAFGLPLPICSCGVLPLYHTLIKKGVPIPAAIGFLIATPEIGFDAVFISFALLGQNLTLVRLICAFLLAVIVAVTFSYFFKLHKNLSDNDEAQEESPFKDRLKAGLKYGFVDLVDHTIPWILLGIFIAAVMERFISYDFFSGFSSLQHVIILALVGIPLYVCASGATPLAAILLHKGVSPGAIIAFLLAGPATNVSTFGILNKLHGKKFAVLFGAGVLLVAIGLGISVDLMDIPVDKIGHGQMEEEPPLYKVVASAGLIFIIVISFIRQGLRHFIDQIYRPQHDY